MYLFGLFFTGLLPGDIDQLPAALGPHAIADQPYLGGQVRAPLLGCDGLDYAGFVRPVRLSLGGGANPRVQSRRLRLRNLQEFHPRAIR